MSTAADLQILQDRIKRDPNGYLAEFQQQHQHFQSQFDIFQLKPSKDHKEFLCLVKFLAAVAPCYPEHLRNFPTQVSDLLEKNATILQPDLRKALVKSLILLRNRNLLSPTSLLSLFFKLFRCPDKALRVLLRTHIITDITRENSRKQSVELNKTLQNFMYTMFQDESNTSIAPRESLAVLIELFKNKVWNDAKTVNVISLGIFSKDAKMISLTLNFFLKPLKPGEDSDEDEEKLPTVKQVKKKYEKKMAKQTRSRKRKLENKLKELQKKRRDKLREEVDDTLQYNHAAILLINDPQAYAEKVFTSLKKSNQAFGTKIGMMNLISRLISANQLMIDNFYSFLQKYTQPHQQHITQILAILAQSIHPMVTPEIIEPLIRHIANAFVADRRPPEVISIGINTIREICIRSPLVMNATLLKDITQYKHHKNRGVVMAARSMIEVFRAINPMLLPRKERGKDTDLNIVPYEYGQRPMLKAKTNPDEEEKSKEEDSNSWETVSDGEGSGSEISDEEDNPSEMSITEGNLDSSVAEYGNYDQDSGDNAESFSDDFNIEGFELVSDDEEIPDEYFDNTEDNDIDNEEVNNNEEGDQQVEVEPEEEFISIPNDDFQESNQQVETEPEEEFISIPNDEDGEKQENVDLQQEEKGDSEQPEKIETTEKKKRR